MKVKVIHEFKDAEYDLVLRTVGEELEVPDERGSYLVNFGVAKELPVNQKGGDPESPKKAKGQKPWSEDSKLHGDTGIPTVDVRHTKTVSADSTEKTVKE